MCCLTTSNALISKLIRGGKERIYERSKARELRRVPIISTRLFVFGNMLHISLIAQSAWISNERCRTRGFRRNKMKDEDAAGYFPPVVSAHHIVKGLMVYAKLV